MGTITSAHLGQALGYPEYTHRVATLLEAGKTTGTNHTEAFLEYSKLNLHRMKRVEKTTLLLPALVDLLPQLPPMEWVALSEGWCGDAAQNLPIFSALAQASQGRIRLSVLLRDEHLDVMDQYLTNGGRSIPKVIFLERDTLKELGQWGPRPRPVQEMVMEHKANPVKEYAEVAEAVQRWYLKDRGQTVQQELWALLQTLAQAPGK